MRKIILSFTYILFGIATGFCQQSEKPYLLGSVSDFQHQLVRQTQLCTELKVDPSPCPIFLSLPGGDTLEAQVNYVVNANGVSSFQGAIRGGGSFSIRIHKGVIEGNIILMQQKGAYTYYSDNKGYAYIQEVDINKIICVGLPVPKDKEEKGNTQAKPTIDPEVGNLQSYPGAAGCILLDFDGHEMPAGNGWNNGNAISAAASGMTNDDIEMAWQVIAEDFAPFSINITTNDSVFNTYPMNKRRRCVITPTNYFYTGAGGVAFLNDFSTNDDSPCWVFTSGVGTGYKYVAEAASHEIGHTLGLSHDGTDTQGYYEGHNNWAPIMGVGYYRAVVQWSSGQYPLANNIEDDLAIIAGATNGVGYRPDDHSGTASTATPLSHVNGFASNENNNGIIGTTNDVDWFSFVTAGGNASFEVWANININNGSLGSDNSNVRIRATLYNDLNQVIVTDSAADNFLSSPIILDAPNLAAGTYIIAVTGIGETPVATGYTSYGSLGHYRISGNFVNVPLPVSSIILKGDVIDNVRTRLYWTTLSEQNNLGFDIERSADGIHFSGIDFVSTKAEQGNSQAPVDYQFMDSNAIPGISYYRLKQSDADGRSSFSNIISLSRKSSDIPSVEIYPNPVQDYVVVNRDNVVSEAVVTVLDVTGRVVQARAFNGGSMIVDLSMFSKGLYVLKYIDKKYNKTIKIVKE